LPLSVGRLGDPRAGKALNKNYTEVKKKKLERGPPREIFKKYLERS